MARDALALAMLEEQRGAAAAPQEGAQVCYSFGLDKNDSPRSAPNLQV